MFANNFHCFPFRNRYFRLREFVIFRIDEVLYGIRNGCPFIFMSYLSLVAIYLEVKSLKSLKSM